MGLATRLLDWIEGYDEYEDEEIYDVPTRSAREPHRRHSTIGTAPITNASVTLMVLCSVQDAHRIADLIVEGQAVIFSIAATPRALARRLVDFVGGALYAKDAQIERIATDTFLAAPADVDIYNP